MSIASLQPGEWARHCPPADRGTTIEAGPIYARTNGQSYRTEVYENFREPSAIAVRNGEPLNLRTSFHVGGDESDTPRGLTFESS